MAKTKKAHHEEPMEQLLWTSANKLRKNMDAAEYKHIVLGLVFLKYISDSFNDLFIKLTNGEGEFEGADPNDPNEYLAENVFFVPEKARWSYLQARAKLPTIGTDVDAAMEAIEEANPALTGVLPKEYAKEKLDKQSLGGLIDLIGTIALGDSASKSKDVLGRVYEYFLGQFALAEGKKGGQFYTPSCVVQLLVELLQPYRGRVFDPCCGSGGMFVQSEKFIQAHRDVYRHGMDEFGSLFDKVVSVYGQESNQTTWRLCKMNLAIRGIDSSNVRWNNEGSFLSDAHEDLKADFIIANPPFNDKDWSGELLTSDYRWKYGVPPVSNANYAWIQHFISHLAPTGKAGFLLATKSLASESQAETTIRAGIVKERLPECIILLPGKLFYTTPAPVCLWILSRDSEPREGKTLFIDASRIFTEVDRTHNKLTPADIEKIAAVYHGWIHQDGTYIDQLGFCKVVDNDTIIDTGFSLYPGDYIGIKSEDSDVKDPATARKVVLERAENTENTIAELESAVAALFARLRKELDSPTGNLYKYVLSEVLKESVATLGERPEPEILTCTENAGLVLQRERFSKRVATDDTSSYKIVRRNDIVYNPYLLWAGAIDQCTIVDEGITSPAYVVLRVKEGFAPALVGHILKTEYMKKWYWNISIGTHERRRTAPIDKFLNLEIELPDFETQKRITEIYAEIDKLSEQLVAVTTAMKSAASGLNEYFTRR